MSGLKKLTGNRKLTLSLIAIVSVIAVCGLVLFLPFQVIYPDCSGDRIYRLSDASKQYLQGITEDVEIIYYSEGGRFNADRGLYRFVKRVAAQNKQIHLRIEDPEKTGSDAEDQSIEIRSALRAKTLVQSDLVYYYNAYMGQMGLEEYASVLTQMSSITDTQTYQSYLSYYGPDAMTAYNRSDRMVVSAIRTVLAERSPQIYVYGNGEYAINSLLKVQLEQSGYTVTALTSVETIPDDCEGLYLDASKDLTASEVAGLSAYLQKGGKVFLTTSFVMAEMPNLFGVLSAYGCSLVGKQNYLCVPNTSENATSSIAMQFSVVKGTHSITNGIDSAVASYAHRMVLEQVEGVTLTPLLQTPELCYCASVYGELLDTGSFPIAVLAETEDSAVVWLSMSLDSTSNNSSGGANFTFVKQSFDYFTQYEGTSLSGIADTQIPSTYLATTNGAMVLWILVFLIGIPATVFTVGAVRRYIRRKNCS